jgi:fatty acid desaturase
MNHFVARVPRPDIRIDRQLLLSLSHPSPARLLLQVIIEWSWIVLLATLAHSIDAWPFSVLCMLLIATRQHALLILMHDFAHHQFSRKGPWNDILANVFTAFPLFITVQGFRADHLKHHQHVSTDHDPNWRNISTRRYDFPKSRPQAGWEVIKHCLGGYTFLDLKGYWVDAGLTVDQSAVTRWQQGVFLLVVAGLATYFHLWTDFFLYWVLPAFTFLLAILYVRDVAEHHALPKAGLLAARTVLPRGFERILFCQNGVNYHTEHHLFPSVPFFRLKRLHQLLLQDPKFRREAVVTRGYWAGLMDEAAALQQVHRTAPGPSAQGL